MEGKKKLFRYNIFFQPSTSSNLYREGVDVLLNQLFKGVVQRVVDTKGRCVYTRLPLPRNYKIEEVWVWDTNAGKEVLLLVDLRPSSKIRNLGPVHLRAVNLALDTPAAICCYKKERVRRLSEWKQGKAVYLGSGLGAWVGHFPSKPVAAYKCLENKMPEAQETKEEELDYSSKKKISQDTSENKENKLIELKQWGLLNIDWKTRDDSVIHLGAEMERRGRSLGLKINKPSFIMRVYPRPSRGFITRLKASLEAIPWAQLIVVIIPSTGQYYGRVKRLVEEGLGAIAQIVRGSTAYFLNEISLDNILSKIATKLRRAPLPFFIQPPWPCILGSPTLIMAGELALCPRFPTSYISTVCGAYDPVGLLSRVEWRVQDWSHGESIKEMEAITRNHLLSFHETNQTRKPSRIIYLRRVNLANSHLQCEAEIKSKEVEAMRSACKSLEEDYAPFITFLVVNTSGIATTNSANFFNDSLKLIRQTSIQMTSYSRNCKRLLDDSKDDEGSLACLWEFLCRPLPTVSLAWPAPLHTAHLATNAIFSTISQLQDINESTKEELEHQLQKVFVTKVPLLRI